MRFRDAMSRGLIIILFPLAAGMVLMGQDSSGQLKQQIASALKRPWQLTGFESINSDSAPWNSWIKDERHGYAVTCEDPTRTLEEAGSKSATSSSAKRHPGVLLWLIRRNPTTSPDKIQADLRKAYPPMVQMAVPRLLGFNDRFVVACMGDCAEEQVENIASSLHLKQFSH